MATHKIDNITTGLVVAFDADTGDVVYMHERLVESIDDAVVEVHLPNAEYCESIRCQAAEAYPRRRIDAIPAPPEATPPEGRRLHVDPMTQRLWHMPDIAIPEREGSDDPLL